VAGPLPPPYDAETVCAPPARLDVMYVAAPSTSGSLASGPFWLLNVTSPRPTSARRPRAGGHFIVQRPRTADGKAGALATMIQRLFAVSTQRRFAVRRKRSKPRGENPLARAPACKMPEGDKKTHSLMRQTREPEEKIRSLALRVRKPAQTQTRALAWRSAASRKAAPRVARPCSLPPNSLRSTGEN
jgi:hypothetical protein